MYVKLCTDLKSSIHSNKKQILQSENHLKDFKTPISELLEKKEELLNNAKDLPKIQEYRIYLNNLIMELDNNSNESGNSNNLCIPTKIAKKYEKKDSLEISVNKGDSCLILHFHQSEWCIVKKGYEVGWIPKNCLSKSEIELDKQNKKKLLEQYQTKSLLTLNNTPRQPTSPKQSISPRLQNNSPRQSSSPRYAKSSNPTTFEDSSICDSVEESNDVQNNFGQVKRDLNWPTYLPPMPEEVPKNDISVAFVDFVLL